MEFTKGIVVRSNDGSNIVLVVIARTGKLPRNGFRAIVIYEPYKTYGIGYVNTWHIDDFHPFDLQPAIEEALKTNNHE